MNPKVSIIVTCFNSNLISGDNVFEKTFNSIKDQSIGFENIELILVDDCSSDEESIQLLKKYANEYANVYFFSTPENIGGPCVSRNIGIKNSSADFIMFLDHDDSLNVQTVEIMYNKIKNSSCDFIKFNFNVTTNQSHIITDNDLTEITVEPKSSKLEYVSLYVWDGIYRKEFLTKNNIQFEQFKITEDFLFIVECICKTNNNICVLPNFNGINYYTGNQLSISHNCNDLNNLKVHITVLNKCMSKLIHENINEKYINSVLTNFKVSAMIYLFYSVNSSDIKNRMFDLIRDFCLKYNYPFVYSRDLKFIHYIFWKVIHFSIIHNNKSVIFKLLDIVKIFKKTNRQ